MSASARTIPSLRLPTAGSRFATGNSAASSSASTCRKRPKQRNRDAPRKGRPQEGRLQVSTENRIRGRGAAGFLSFFVSPSKLSEDRHPRRVTDDRPEGRKR